MTKTIFIIICALLVGATFRPIITDMTMMGEGTNESPLVVDTHMIATQFDIAFPMGEVRYFNTTGTSTVISLSSDGSTNLAKAAGTTTFSGHLFDMPTDGRLRYIGPDSVMCHVACTISFSPDAANDQFVFAVAKNGTPLDASKVLNRGTNTSDKQSTAMHVMTTLKTNEYLELYVGNVTDADDVTIYSINLFAMGLYATHQ